MEVKSCKVTISDVDGIAHTVTVTAVTLYEAVALGLKTVRGHEWVEGIAAVFGSIKVVVQNVPVEYAVQLKEFKRWLEQKAEARQK